MRLIRYTVFVVGLLRAVPSYAQGTGGAGCTRIDLTSSLFSDARRSLWSTLNIERNGGSEFFRSRSAGAMVCADSAAFLQTWSMPAATRSWQVLPVEAVLRTNSAYPRTENDGAAWLGVGANLGFTAGIRAHWRFVNVSLAPEIYHQQNKAFTYVANTTGSLSSYGDPYHFNEIDYPTRFGPDAFNTLVPGQSYIQVASDKVGATFGTENVWLGAAEVYPILLSYTAPGFTHLRLGSQRPLNIPFARIEFQIFFASLSESKYFDANHTNDSHYFTAALISVQPKFLSGLSVGVARALHDSLSVKGQGPGFFTSRLIDNPFGGTHTGNRPGGNGIGIILARWALPESRFEAYGEWSREDTPGGFVDLLREPDWTQAYVVGFSKGYLTSKRLTRFYGELVHLGESAPARAGRGFFSYYTHSTVRQGHTNEGQLLGAAIGPGSDAQLLGADLFDGRSRTGVRVQRTRYDDDTYYRTFARRWGESRHDAEITLSGTRTQMVRSFEFEAGLALSRRYGRQFIPLPSEAPDLVENNLSLHLSAAWRPRL